MKRTFWTVVLAVELPVFVTIAAAQQKPGTPSQENSKPAAKAATKPAMSGDKGAVMAVIKEFENDFNSGNSSWVRLCADQASIIDEFPPYAWSGSGACKQWGDDYAADAQKTGVTSPSVWFGPAKHLDVVGDRAYVVLPASYSYKKNGKATKEAGAMITITLQKSGNDWRVTAWAWSKGTASAS